MNFEKVQAMLSKQLDIPLENISLETRLSEDLKADSLDLVELVMDLEQEFSIQIPEEELPNIRTVGDIVAFFNK
jgi:acyl carrier protein